MSWDFIFRIFGMIFAGAGGAWLGANIGQMTNNPEQALTSTIVMGLVGALVGLVLTPYVTIRPMNSIRKLLSRISARTLFVGILGLIISLIISALLALPLATLPTPLNQILPFVVLVIVSYFGVMVFVSRQNDVYNVLSFFPKAFKENSEKDDNTPRQVLMDTSVIIDGRIVDIARTGFIPGTLLIPRFVLNELQYIADSEDTLRRQRGRRGLDVLADLQKDTTIPVRISDIDVEGSRAVDDKLIILARQLHCPVLTNDYNMNRVAELQGVTILNINELANAVKAIYLPGELLNVRIIQEGREPGQGVGYLEDGTMIVVQDGDQYLDKQIRTIVTKVLQTTAGRMIFSRPDQHEK